MTAVGVGPDSVVGIEGVQEVIIIATVIKRIMSLRAVREAISRLMRGHLHLTQVQVLLRFARNDTNNFFMAQLSVGSVLPVMYLLLVMYLLVFL